MQILGYPVAFDMTLRAQLDAVATLLDEGAASSAVRMLRNSWEPELPVDQLVPLYCMWIRGLCDTYELTAAKTLAERAGDEFPREPDIQIALGNVYDLRGELEAARDAFRTALEADDSLALAHYNLGAVLERLGEEDEAENCYREAIVCETEGGSMFEASAALGALLRRTGRLEEAAGVYEGYLDEDPINVDILVEHGICLSDLDEFEDAVQRFELALSLDSGHGGAWYNLAITLYRMGQHDDAIQAMHRAHRADPEGPLTLAVLGSWLLAKGDAELDEALRMLYSALEIVIELAAMEHVGSGYASLVFEEVFEALWQRSRNAEAREVARRAAQRDWITAHMLNTLNEADHGRSESATAYTVMARAEAGEAPGHWPKDASGYVTGLTVLAQDEDEARRYSLEYLRNIEAPGVLVRIETIRPGGVDELSDPAPRARGVVGVRTGRDYYQG